MRCKRNVFLRAESSNLPPSFEVGPYCGVTDKNTFLFKERKQITEKSIKTENDHKSIWMRNDNSKEKFEQRAEEVMEILKK